MTSDKIKITEIFRAMQGEGPCMGRPAVFIRTFGCPFQCAWCDSKYSWEDGATSTEMTGSEIVSKVEELAAGTGKAIAVVTGGEPFIHDMMTQLPIQLSNISCIHHVEIETSGAMNSQAINALFNQSVDIAFNVSPKLWWPDDRLEKVIHEWETRIWNWCIPDFSDITRPRVAMKFVVDMGSTEEIKRFQKYAKLLPRSLVWIMPRTHDGKYSIESDRAAAKYALQHGYNFAPRLHVQLGLR